MHFWLCYLEVELRKGELIKGVECVTAGHVERTPLSPDITSSVFTTSISMQLESALSIE